MNNASSKKKIILKNVKILDFCNPHNGKRKVMLKTQKVNISVFHDLHSGRRKGEGKIVNIRLIRFPHFDFA